MSSRQRKKAAAPKEGAEGRKAAPREKVLKPGGAVPTAVITARHSAGTVSRTGKGFSLGELASAQLAFAVAKRWGVPLDLRRRSVLDGNVAAVKTWAAGAKTVKAEGTVKKVEEELAKVEKEVKEEAVKVEREAKEEVEKVEKKVTKKKKAPAKKRAPRKKPSSKKSG